MVISLLSNRSLLFNATTSGMPSSSSCVVNSRLRLRLVASTMLMITSGASFLTKSRVMFSSHVNADKEYAPGRSTTRIFFPDLFSSFFTSPSFLATVTPGQLPTCSILPVMALNKVVLPLFGFPASAMRIISLPAFIFFRRCFSQAARLNQDRSGQIAVDAVPGIFDMDDVVFGQS